MLPKNAMKNEANPSKEARDYIRKIQNLKNAPVKTHRHGEVMGHFFHGTFVFYSNGQTVFSSKSAKETFHWLSNQIKTA